MNQSTFTASSNTTACTKALTQSRLLGVPDKYMVLILPVFAFWSLSLLFHILDENDFLAKYKIHTPEEFLKRNRVPMRDVIRDVAVQHLFQIVVGAILAWHEPETYTGCESQEVLAWAAWIRDLVGKGLRALPIAGIDSARLIDQLRTDVPAPDRQIAGTVIKPEMLAAELLYWVLVPLSQYFVATFVVDTWQYFIHRAMHLNSWLYRNFHSRHHRLYVPYAFGAIYNHPVEGLLVDILGYGIAFKLARMSVRQGTWFFTIATIKGVIDHSGFELPWDPFHLLTENNAYYHDIHHQSWGMKVR